MHALLTPHVGRDGADAAQGRFAGGRWCFLEPGLDGVDGGIAEGAHGAADEANEERLVAGQAGFFGSVTWWRTIGQRRLQRFEPGFKGAVGAEVHGLVGALPQRCQRDPAI